MKIIKFSAVWCPGCLVMKPVWKKVEEKYPNLDIIEYDYDINEDEVNIYNVGDKLPVVIKFDDNDLEVGRLIGEKKENEIIEFIGED